MLEIDEAVLIGRAQAGDREAYAALIECHGKLIYRQLSGLTRNAHAAEDLTQEVFLKAWANLKSFKPGTYFRAWLARIARNAFLNSRRDKRVTIGHERLVETLAARDPGPVAALVARETQALVEAAEAGLPRTCRAAFRLRTRQDLPFQDVGRALALTPATARWHVFQARHLLRKRLRPLWEEQTN